MMNVLFKSKKMTPKEYATYFTFCESIGIRVYPVPINHARNIVLEVEYNFNNQKKTTRKRGNIIYNNTNKDSIKWAKKQGEMLKYFYEKHNQEERKIA